MLTSEQLHDCPPQGKRGLTVDHQNSRKKLVKALERRESADGKRRPGSEKQNSTWSRKGSERRTFTPLRSDHLDPSGCFSFTHEREGWNDKNMNVEEEERGTSNLRLEHQKNL